MSKAAQHPEEREPTLSILGLVPVVTWLPLDRLPARYDARLEAIRSAKRAPEAARLAIALEEAMGITVEERIGAVRANERWEVDLEAALVAAVANLPSPPAPKGKRAAVLPVQPDAIMLPAAERGFGPDAIERFDRARQALLSPVSKQQAKDAAAQQIANIEASPKAEADRAWLEAGEAETIALASRRGEEVERVGDRLVISSRDDGLRGLYLGEKLSEIQYATGKRCRDCYEARSGDVGSQLGGQGIGAGHDNDRFVWARHDRAVMTAAISKIELQISVRLARSPAALQMFRWTIAQGQQIRAFGGGRSYYLNVQSLADALDVAAQVFKKLDEERRPLDAASGRARNTAA